MAQRRHKPEEELFCTFYKKYKKDVYRFLLSRVKNKEIAEDLTSETFLKILVAIQKGMYVERGNPKSWIMRIANNLMISHFRYTKRVLCGELVDVEDEAKNPQISLEISNKFEIAKGVILRHLTKKQREVLIGRLILGEKFKEISFRTGENMITLRVRYTVALSKLRSLLGKNH